LGEYLWRTFDASRNRPPYIVEDENHPKSDGKTSNGE
jgi:dolichol-phosphate mannosyltransferase